MKKTLLRKKPYTVTTVDKKYQALKICLHPLCGFTGGEKVFQVRQEDGVIELIPERSFDPGKYGI